MDSATRAALLAPPREAGQHSGSASATIREEIAQAELVNHDKQIENAQKIDEYLKDKFTNQELYSWMQGQLAAQYFQAYKLAYDVAKKAEQAFRHELGL